MSWIAPGAHAQDMEYLADLLLNALLNPVALVTSVVVWVLLISGTAARLLELVDDLH